MSRNRMRNSQSLHWMGVVKWVLIAGLLSGLGLSYMLCKNRNLHLAAETHRLQLQLAAIETRNQELKGDLDGMKSMDLLERRLAEMHSTLIHLNDPRATWISFEQNTSARVERMGTLPNPGLQSSVMAANAVSSQPVH